MGELPQSLDATYERILQDINEENWNVALHLFQCVAVASRPLRVEELAELLAFDFDVGPTPTFLEDWRPEDPIGAVLSTCSSLLAVVKVNGLVSIQFSHFSVKEYLVSTRLARKSATISRYHVSMTPAHTIMAQACLGILLHLDEEVTNDSLKNFPFAEYAAQNWLDHIRFDNVSANAQDGIKRLFSPTRPHLMTMVWIHDPEIPWWTRSERLSSPKGTNLHYAALSGLPDLLKFLVTEFTLDLNARGFFDDVTPLHLASRDGHVEVARVLLEHGADVNAKDISKWTPLRHALDKGHVETARVLIKNGADVGAQGVDDWMPLHWASRHGQVDLVQMLLDHGADMDSKDIYGWIPWRRALDEGHIEVVRVLSQYNPALSPQTKRTGTSLHEASRCGDVEFVRALLKYGADVSAQDENQSTPLYLALRNGHVEVALVLLEHGADANSQSEDKWTPLHWASEGGHVELVGALLEHNADASAPDENSFTPLQLALREEHVKVALLLVERGADASVRDSSNSSRTPLHWASDRGHVELARALLEHGADVNAQDKNRSTPLYLALRGGHVDVALMLLEHGADANFRDEDKSTPLHWASKGGHVEFARALLRYGVDPNVQNKNKSTSLHLALRCTCHIISAPMSTTRHQRASSCKHFEVARVLLKHGTDANLQYIFGSTPSHLVSQGGQVEVSRVLLEQGTDLSTLDKDKLTSLQLAFRCSESCHTNSTEFSLESIFGLSPPSSPEFSPPSSVERTPVSSPVLLPASTIGLLPIPTIELSRALTPESPWASSCTHLKVAQLLLEHGADANIRDIFQSTPLHLASQGGHAELTRTLLEHGADLGAQNKVNLTPLHLALRCSCRPFSSHTLWRLSCKHLEVARVLLECGADANARDIFTRMITFHRARMIAKFSGITELLSQLYYVSRL